MVAVAGLRGGHVSRGRESVVRRDFCLLDAIDSALTSRSIVVHPAHVQRLWHHACRRLDVVSPKARVHPRNSVIMRRRKNRPTRVRNLEKRLVVHHRHVGAHGAWERHLFRKKRSLLLFVGTTPVLQVGFGSALLAADQVVALGLFAGVVADVGELAHCVEGWPIYY